MRPALRLVMVLVATVGLALVAPAVSAQGASIDEATEEQKAAATEAYQRGRDAFDARRFVDALAAFRESYAIVRSPNTHLMVGHAQRELGRFGDAYATFGQAAIGADEAAATEPKYADSAKLAREEQSMLRAKVGLLRIDIRSAPPDAKLTIRGRDVDSERWAGPHALNPGDVNVVLTTGDRSVVEEVTVEPGGEHEVVLDATEATSSSGATKTDFASTSRIAAYIIAGVGVLSFGAAVGLGVAAQSQFDELQDACGDLPCPERQPDIDRGRRFQTASNVMIVVGAVLVAGGVVLWLAAPDGETEASVGIAPGFGGATLWGRF